jgi:hypothetical protein
MISDEEFSAHNSYSLRHYGSICRCQDCNDLRTYNAAILASVYGDENLEVKILRGEDVEI